MEYMQVKISVSGLTHFLKEKNRNLVFILAAIASLTQVARANYDGVLEPVSGPYEHIFQFYNSDFSINSIGRTVSRLAETSTGISAKVSCSKALPASAAIYYTASTGLLPSKSNPGYRYHNEYFDIKIEVYIGGAVNGYVTAPFSGYSDRKAISQRCTPPGSNLSTKLTSGTKMKVTLLTTKKILNGMNFGMKRIVDLTGTYGLSAVAGSTHSLVYASMYGATITVPDQCIINEGTPISIEFGPVGSSGEKLNGQNYKKPIPINVECKGGSFTQGSLNIKMSVQSAGSGTASFNRNYLGTSGTVNRNDLGIVIRDKSNAVITPNAFYSIDSLNANRGSWELTAAPVAKPGTDIPEGEFHSSATLLAEFN